MDKPVQLQALLDRTKSADFLAPLLMRLYLVPVLWLAGYSKYNDFENTVAWFANSEWGLGLPLPWLMAFLATGTEILGAILLLIGLGTRWISIPLMITMIVAAVSVHLQNGWQAIADAKFCLFNCADAEAATEKLERARDILREHGNYEWLSEQGSFVILNNGIEFAATYFIMLLALFFIGGGRYVSLDYWIKQRITV